MGPPNDTRVGSPFSAAHAALPRHAVEIPARRLLRRRVIAPGLVAWLSLFFALVAPATAAQPLFGFNEDWLATGHEIEAAGPFRPTVHRLHLNWSLIEQTRGVYIWESFDEMYRRMVAQGAPPIAMVFAPPCWAAVSSACPATRVHAVDPRHYAAWERFVTAVVRRYPRLAALEVWNEPNYGTYYSPRPDAGSYVETLRHAYRASKAARPELPVLGGSLAPITTRRGARREGGFPRNPPDKVPYAVFLDQMYARGAGRYMDGLAFHPYPNFAPYLRVTRLAAGRVRRGFASGIVRDIAKQLSTVRRIARRHGTREPVWATETGVCTTGPRERRASRREQAVALRRTYLTLERLGARAIITHRLWDVRLPGTPANNIENGCGLMDMRGRQKPAWRTLYRLRERSGEPTEGSRVRRPRIAKPRAASGG